MIIFDIETRPHSIQTLKRVVKPFDPDSFGPPPGPFDANSVKTGNIKDPKKIAERVKLAEEKHEKNAASYADDLAKAEADYWSGEYSKAALSAETGSVCAIGYCNDRGGMNIDLDLEFSEAEVLRRFWFKFESCRSKSPQRNIVGFNSNRFDIPFMVRRSWYCDVEVPHGVFTATGYVSQLFIDLLDKWQCGDRRSFVSLDKVCRACGIAGKPDDCSGDRFHEMLDDEKTRDAAIEYLKNDLAMTVGLARRMRIL